MQGLVGPQGAEGSEGSGAAGRVRGVLGVRARVKMRADGFLGRSGRPGGFSRWLGVVVLLGVMIGSVVGEILRPAVAAEVLPTAEGHWVYQAKDVEKHTRIVIGINALGDIGLQSPDDVRLYIEGRHQWHVQRALEAIRAHSEFKVRQVSRYQDANGIVYFYRDGDRPEVYERLQAHVGTFFYSPRNRSLSWRKQMREQAAKEKQRTVAENLERSGVRELWTNSPRPGFPFRRFVVARYRHNVPANFPQTLKTMIRGIADLDSSNAIVPSIFNRDLALSGGLDVTPLDGAILYALSRINWEPDQDRKDTLKAMLPLVYDRLEHYYNATVIH